MQPKLTTIVKEMGDEIKSLLSSNSSIVEKTVFLRRIARQIASDYCDGVQYKNIDEFYQQYESGETPLKELEGEGVNFDGIIILKKCPMASLFDHFRQQGKFPDYWSEIPRQFMLAFRNEAVLHPLCIVHQNFRDELAAKILKGKSFVHSIAVACRSGEGRIVFSEFGLGLASKTKEEMGRMIDGKACAFYVT